MARLKSRGRTELFRVEKEHTFTDEERAARKSDVIWDRSVKTLMSDGNVLEKVSSKWPDQYEPGGVRKHDWDWKVVAKLKPGGDPKKLLDQYVAKGYRVVSTGFSLNSFDVAAYGAAEAIRKKNVEKGRIRRAEAEKKALAPGGKDGPGFYVTNVNAMSAMGKRVAELGPYATFEEAEGKAAERLRGFVQMKFLYLLPVQVVEAQGRREAEWGKGHVYWADGKGKGPPVHPGQARLPGMNGDAP
jgi:hypothetical protein